MHALAEAVGAKTFDTALEVIHAADLTLLTVPDDVIVPLASLIAESGDDFTGKAVIHTSGAHGADSLRVLAERGTMTGGLHPAFPFADIPTAIARLPGATFAIETDDPRLHDWLYAMAKALDGRVLAIPRGKKALYHSALVIASNYAVTLYAIAERVLLSLGAERATADHALNVLVGATADNLRVQGIPEALTGPLVRGDVGTVAAHLTALENYDKEAAQLYLELARLSLPLLEARGVLTQAVEDVLRQTENDHPNNHS
jgi:predicted short-subunit dehydrogenase-like oxidoreductase (DUF2520 family)